MNPAQELTSLEEISARMVELQGLQNVFFLASLTESSDESPRLGPIRFKEEPLFIPKLIYEKALVCQGLFIYC
jgi:hypothetical protein